jgi:hypothetical protein
MPANAKHLHAIAGSSVFFVHHGDVAKAQGFNQRLNNLVMRDRPVGCGCLWNWNLCQLRPPNFGQRAGDKRASAHSVASFLMWVELNYNKRCASGMRMNLLIPAKERRLLGKLLL